MEQQVAFERRTERRQGEGGVPGTGQPVGPAPVLLSHAALALRLARKVAVAVAGGALLILGVALIVLPGPAIIVIPLGLAVLATEFPWAARFLRYLKERVGVVMERLRRALPRRSHTPVR